MENSVNQNQEVPNDVLTPQSTTISSVIAIPKAKPIGWRVIGLVLFCIIIASAAATYLFFAKSNSSPIKFATQAECEKKTRGSCISYPCDIPIGDTYQKICIKGAGSGWYNEALLGKSESVVSPTTSIVPTNEPKQNPEVIFAYNLSSCTKYKTTFKHPLTGETLEKEILGIINNKCNYVEQMPSGGKMECKYSESERLAVAQYYKDVAEAESVGVNLKVNLGSVEQKTTYTIDGKSVENPLQEANKSGSCKISGY